jgi:hypothetical protein
MIPEILRRFIASTLIWFTFFAMYVLAVGVLGLGVYFTGESWWAKYRQQASWWTMAFQSGRVILLALALIFVLALPLTHIFGEWRKGQSWRDERRSGLKDLPPGRTSRRG